MDKNSLENLLKDKDFVKKILEMETPEEVQRSFKENNIDFSIDEIKLMGRIVNECLKEVRSLPEAELSKISAGSVGDFFKGAGLGALDAVPGGGLAYKALTGYETGSEIDDPGSMGAANAGYHTGKGLTYVIGAAGLITATTVVVCKNPKAVKWAVDKVKSIGSSITKKITK